MEIRQLRKGFNQYLPALENFLQSNLLKKMNARLYSARPSDPTTVSEILKSGMAIAKTRDKTFDIPVYIAFDENWIPLISAIELKGETAELDDETRDEMQQFTRKLLDTVQLKFKQTSIPVNFGGIQIFDSKQIIHAVDETRTEYFVGQIDIDGNFKVQGKKRPEIAMIVAFEIPADEKIETIIGTVKPERPNTPENDTITVTTSYNKFSDYWINIVIIALLLITEAIGAYTVVAYNYPALYEMVYNKPIDLGAFYEIQNITVNPAETRGTGFLVVSISIQVKSEEDLKKIRQKNMVIKDAIITQLSSRTVKELSELQDRSNLKQTIGSKINQIINKEAVKDLFFTKYVIQVN